VAQKIAVVIPNSLSRTVASMDAGDEPPWMGSRRVRERLLGMTAAGRGNNTVE